MDASRSDISPLLLLQRKTLLARAQTSQSTNLAKKMNPLPSRIRFRMTFKIYWVLPCPKKHLW